MEKKRPITAEDLLKITYVGDPQVSPTKDKAAYVVTNMDLDKDGYCSAIYVTDFKGEGKRFTFYYDSEKLIRDQMPRWSPDGQTIAFLSNRTGKNQIWFIPADGGEAQPVTNLEQDVLEYTWSPDGQALALVVKGQIKPSNGQEQKEQDEEKSDVKEVTRLRYKGDGAGILDEKRRCVYLYQIESKTYTLISDENYDFAAPRFSPDGKTLIYLGSKDERQEWEYIPSIWKYDLSSGKEELFYEGKGVVSAPSFSPDGRWLAFVGHDQGAHTSTNDNVWVLSAQTGEVKNLSSALDCTVGNLVGVDAKYDPAELRLIWSEDSTEIYFIATVGGDVKLFKTNLDGQVSEALTASSAVVTSFDLINPFQALLVQATPFSPGDLVIQDVRLVENSKRITAFNRQLLEEDVWLSAPERITYRSTDGWEIEGWMLKPFSFSPDRKYPLILQIHGGPHTAYGNGLHHEMQLMAGKGYVVLYTNPRGSHGYGQEFVRAVVGDYGGMDYTDIMAGVDYVLENYDFIDERQLFVTGGSYGGYMTNVIVTRTDRFKAAVTQRSICNWHSFYGTSDIGFYFTKWQHGDADLWEDEDRLLQLSPIRHVRNVKTPILILHSEQDLRCPMEQAEQWYVALKRLGVETKLVRFPDENHDLSRSGKPKHRLERLKHLIGWFEERTEKGVAATNER